MQLSIHIACPSLAVIPAYLAIYISIPSNVSVTGPCSNFTSPALYPGDPLLINPYVSALISTDLIDPDRILIRIYVTSALGLPFDYSPIFNFTYYSVGF